MKKLLQLIIIFSTTFIIYFGVSSNFDFKPKWALDYFNPLAQSLMHGRFDIVSPGATHDLVYFQDKWYVLWGILPSLILIPLQLIKGRFIPTIYLTIFFASLNTVLVYLILLRFKKEFFPRLRTYEIYLLMTLFAFGTTHFYVSTLGSVWHVSQMVTFFFGTLGLYVVFKKKRRLKDYLLSSILFSIALIGRATAVLMIVLPMLLYCYEFFLSKKTTTQKRRMLIKGVAIFGLPLTIFFIFFFLYNYFRFENPLEYGYRYIQEAPNLAQIRQRHGMISLYYMPTNLWYMFLEIPRLSFRDRPVLDFNLYGNSILFLTPPFLAAFLAVPVRRRSLRLVVDPYITSLWLTAVVTMLPVVAFYSSGWMQFGFRYSLDITVILLLLSVFGMHGRLNFLYILGIVFSILMYFLGINALM